MTVPPFPFFFPLRQTLSSLSLFALKHVVFITQSFPKTIKESQGVCAGRAVTFSASVIPFTLEWHLISHYFSSAPSFDRVKLCFSAFEFL